MTDAEINRIGKEKYAQEFATFVDTKENQGKLFLLNVVTDDYQITQTVIEHSDRTRFQEFVKGSIINKLTFALRAVDILIVAAAEDG